MQQFNCSLSQILNKTKNGSMRSWCLAEFTRKFNVYIKRHDPAYEQFQRPEPKLVWA